MIYIHGDGLTALTIARRLMLTGKEVCLIRKNEVNPLTVLIGRQTFNLLADIFSEPSLVDVGYNVNEKIVNWSDGNSASQFAPSASISMQNLISALEPKLHDVDICSTFEFCDDQRADSDWVVDATGAGCHVAAKLTGLTPTFYGQRRIVSCEINTNCRLNQAIMESVPRGWLFCFPISLDKAVVQLMTVSDTTNLTACLSEALDQTQSSKLVSAGIITESIESTHAAPKLFPLLGETGWLAAGPAAFSMDPICGDGTGAAVRSALLAAATIQAPDEHRGSALQHYINRHMRSFVAHMSHVYEYYKGSSTAHIWARELDATYDFLSSMRLSYYQNLNDGSFKFKLNDDQLEYI